MSAGWLIRAGRGSENIEAFLGTSVVALGDERLGPLSPSVTKERLLELYAEHYGDAKVGARATWAGHFLRFLSEIKIGDTVVTFDRDRRLYLLGNVVSDYEWAPKVVHEKPHVRRVKWTHQVSRDDLSQPARNTLGAIQTLFKLNAEVMKELASHEVPIGAAISKPEAPPAPIGSEKNEDDLRAEMIEKADEFIEDAISALSWDEMQVLVAGILRAMGFRTRVALPGPDRGADIVASPDGLGLQEPRIFVEVKHRDATSMGAKEIRAFLGGRRRGDRCLYVSTGGFTKDAQYEADRADVPATLVNMPALRQLLIDNYETLDEESRALVPLRRLYWPVSPLR